MGRSVSRVMWRGLAVVSLEGQSAAEMDDGGIEAASGTVAEGA
jgi:hypothetical protein